MRMIHNCALLLIAMTACSPTTESHQEEKSSIAIISGGDGVSAKVNPQPKMVGSGTNPLNLEKSELTLRAKQFLDDQGRLAAQCDSRHDAVNRTLEAQNVDELYEATRSAAEECKITSGKISEIMTPLFLSTEGQLRVKQGIQKLAAAYTTRAEGFEKLESVASGDLRPAVSADARATMKASQDQLHEALTTIIDTFISEGADPHGLYE